MEFLVLKDYLNGRKMHYPSKDYPSLPRTNDCEGFNIIDDNGWVLFSGYIYNSSTAYGDDFEEVLAFMDEFGGTKLTVRGEVILG